MNVHEFETLSGKVGVGPAAIILALRQVEDALMNHFERPEPFPSVLQSAEDERREARNEGKL